jgi:Zn-dependent peptidase ImmA (M78 family)/DNA-binding XRE family transcriptional regulator
MDSFEARLKAARKMAGMSMQALSDATNNAVTKQAISKFEKGKMSPASDTLIALANALKVKPDFFYRESNVELPNLEFRKKSRLLKGDRERIEYQTIDFLERYKEIEIVMNLESSFHNPLSNTVVKGSDDIEKAAVNLRKEWNLGIAPISKLMELLEAQGIRIFEVKNSPSAFDGLSALIDEVPVIAINGDFPLVRKRMTVVHELAHQLLRFEVPDQRTIERLCFIFASAFLMPTEVLMKEIGPKRNNIAMMELKKLKGVYGISIMALMVRIHQLGIITDGYYHEFIKAASRMGWKSGKVPEPGQYIGREYPNRFRQLVERAVAEEIVSMSKGAELMNIGLVAFRRGFQLAA